MYSSSLLVLALAVFGASAQFLSNGCGCGLGCGCACGVSGGIIANGYTTGLVNGAPGLCASTPVLENVPLRLPSIVHPTTVQDSCNCLKTIVRPHLRKEVFTIPSVQRFVQSTSTPVVETVPYVTGSSVDVPTVNAGCGVGGGFGGSVSGFSSCGC